MSPPSPPPVRKTHRRLTTIAIAVGTFMSALEMTVVTTAMPTVVADLGGLHQYAWVFTGYMVAATVMGPIFGKLADLYGRKPVMLINIGLFLAGSVACGAAQSMEALIVFRVLQGIGAGGIGPISMTIASDLYSLNERARIQGVFASVWALSAVVGPALGAIIVKHLTWHWVFLVNVPVGIVTAILIWTCFHEQTVKRPHALDLTGALLLSVGVVGLLFGVQRGSYAPWWLLAAAVMTVLFVLHERRAKEALVPPALFKIPAVTLTNVLNVLSSVSMFGLVTYVPLYIQAVLGGSAASGGRMITPMLVGWPIASTVGGRLLPRVGFRRLVISGMSVAAVAAIGIVLGLTPTAPTWVAFVGMGFFGVGMGLAVPALLLVVQSSVTWEMRGAATAVTMFFRTIGGAVGVGIMGGILGAALSKDPSIPAGAADQLLADPHALSAEVIGKLGTAIDSALAVNFWIVAGCAVLCAALALLFPRKLAQDTTTPQVRAAGTADAAL